MSSESAITLGALATLVGGTVCGDSSIEIIDAAPLAEAAADQITLIDDANKVKQLSSSKASATVAPTGVDCGAMPCIQVDDIHGAFAKIIGHFRPVNQQSFTGISPQAIISPTAKLGNNVTIYAGTFIGEQTVIGDGTTIMPGVRVMDRCKIGSQVVLHPNAVLYNDSIVGDRCTLHVGVVIGSHGFGYTQENGRHVPTSQLGYVELESDVEIGANTTVDRGTYGATTIGSGTKIDNLVQIAHNCKLGKHNMICSQVGIAGSTSTGDYVVMAGQVGVRDHVHVGTGATLAAMAGITNDVADGAVMLGMPAKPIREQRLTMVAVSKLPEMRRGFKVMRKQLAAIEQQLAGDDPTEADRAA